MTDVKFIVAIPARHASSRLPGKPLLPIHGEPMIVHVARRALAAGAGNVVVATDDARIAEAVAALPVTVAMTRSDHASGSDRLAECAEQLKWADDDIIVNLQGDEPQAPVSGIRAVAEALAQDDAPMATLAMPLASVDEFMSPDCVKVAVGKRGQALYFSRAPIPWPRDAFAKDRSRLPPRTPLLRHIGIYAYRAGFLREFARLEPGQLERIESLEQLRALENGHRIAVRLATEPFPAGVDTQADLDRIASIIGMSRQ